ncbi:hypothetical protein FOZ62_017901, partial [Perkinsus olseni]
NLADRLTRPGDIEEPIGDWDEVSSEVMIDPVIAFRGDTMVLSDSEGWDAVDDELDAVDPAFVPECAVADTFSWYPEFKKRLRSHPECSFARSFSVDSSMGLLLSRQFRSDGEDDYVPVIPSGELQDELIEK